ncbi:MAG: YlxR family protein [Bacillota bacterium]
MKHIPERICVGCGAKFPKRDLIRIVLTPDGEVAIDDNGKAPGRGAYVCDNEQCIKTAISKKKLERSLKSSVTVEIKEQLVNHERK